MPFQEEPLFKVEIKLNEIPIRIGTEFIRLAEEDDDGALWYLGNHGDL